MMINNQKLEAPGSTASNGSEVELKMVIALRAADAMARIVDDWVTRGVIDARSAIADARLNYGQPFVYEWSEPQNDKDQRRRVVDSQPETAA